MLPSGVARLSLDTTDTVNAYSLLATAAPKNTSGGTGQSAKTEGDLPTAPYMTAEQARASHDNVWLGRLNAVLEIATLATDYLFTFTTLMNAADQTLFQVSVAIIVLQLVLRLAMALAPLTYGGNLANLWDNGTLMSYFLGVAVATLDMQGGIERINKSLKLPDKNHSTYQSKAVGKGRQLQESLLYCGILMLFFEDLPELVSTWTSSSTATHARAPSQHRARAACSTQPPQRAAVRQSSSWPPQRQPPAAQP